MASSFGSCLEESMKKKEAENPVVYSKTWCSSVCFRNLLQSLRATSSSSKIGCYYGFSSQASSSPQQMCEPSIYRDDDYADLDWDNLGFGIMPTDYMYLMKCSNGEDFEQGQLNRYGNIELGPAAGVLNYGQAVYEGTKVHRKEDGRLLLFRPEQNAIRMKFGAERMSMPSPSIDQFVDAVKQTVLANKRWVPPPGKGSLYIRPLLMGSGQILGLGAAPEYTFLVYVSPVGNYFKGNAISTPAVNGTILPGVTRRSIIEIARDHGYQVEERVIPIDELTDADEVFCTGTAVGVASVGSTTYEGKRIKFKTGAQTVSQELYSTLVGIKTGLIEDKMGWIVEIE
ncbi:branched-chain amino acid aminotransferase 1, mitochondrial-like isoform X4 [Quercus robur]|uniref:branched-chain amino acid aminotransferase 1, mitochondrial-like isoform X4 n=1 Tax=Quercus robur TaxID=38942 RepID=UPI002162DB92|nr:branched-chain amino acid aminotransferase 1, mitochondrial-like isoform X4 [Quercus robur]